ncbi:hypothetical protein C1X35_18980 [Pseudomonas sp. FW306-1C-G01A]|uniref:hypothetical protein n=1 Tax=unclassified Pseudomonas TaxID=196821 RepID=UPI000C86E30C|nr:MULTISPECIES: hypothetical protein [unclassified Pseudomonas]PMV86685.1 hypothetical protein C1X56_13630 [Pseudomonas sp. GW101-1A09]PMV94442.1 hypothetical protein C1X51_12280 [Pseudomonas sp. FW306-2-2C-B10A]PMW04340.1 hypothetical protein C1X50_17945 [Pseudomonas sp. MPR-TSA4]PMW11477.1 hypothetical protein C1X52_21260 [Pseudomonas sp. FW306-2-1A-C05A]PMW33370.1 hypothetical protein C1X48_22870 [Pseudomonas sp. FW305-3-2-15-A-R2A1]
MNEYTLFPFLRTNELSGSIKKYALAVDQYINVDYFENLLEAFESGLLERGFRFCHKGVDDDQYKVHLTSAMRAELGELVLIARWRYMSPNKPLSEIRERIAQDRDDGDALAWADGFIAALEHKGLYVAHSDNLPPFEQPSVELPEARQEESTGKNGVDWSSWKVWGVISIVSLVIGGFIAAAPTIIDNFQRRHELTLDNWRADPYLTLEALPKIEASNQGAVRYSSSTDYWCTGDEVFCSATYTGNLKETLRDMISAIPKSDAKQFKVRLAIVPVESYEDSN